MSVSLKKMDYIFFAIVIIIISFGFYTTVIGNYDRVTDFGGADYEKYVYVSAGGGFGRGDTMRYNGTIQNLCKKPLMNISIFFENGQDSANVIIDYLGVGESLSFEYEMTIDSMSGMVFSKVVACSGSIVYED